MHVARPGVAAGLLVMATLAVPGSASADPGALTISAITFAPSLLPVPSSGDFDTRLTFRVTLPAPDSTLDEIAGHLQSTADPGNRLLARREAGCGGSFVCTRVGGTLDVTNEAFVHGAPLRQAYRNPGRYRPVVTVRVLDGPSATATGERVKVRKQVHGWLSVDPGRARTGQQLTLSGGLGDYRSQTGPKVTLWFDPAGKAEPRRVRKLTITRADNRYVLTTPHRESGHWQQRYTGNGEYAPARSTPDRVRTKN